MTKAATGIIGFHRLQIPSIIGIYPGERDQEQILLVDMKVKMNLTQFYLNDQIEATINYVSLAEICLQLAKNNYFLLESLGRDILDACLQTFPVDWVWVRIQKPAAILSAEYAYVELEKERPACGL